MLKVLEINTERTWRGGERQTMLTVQHFMDAGIQVTLLCREDTPLATRCGGLCKVITSKTHAFVFWWLCLHGAKYDILHVQTARTLTLAILSKPFHRRCVVYTRRVDFPLRGVLTRMKYQMTDGMVTISAAIAAVMKKSNVKTDSVIPDFCSFAEANRARAEALLAAHHISYKKIILTIAALVPHKDPLTMVRAMAALADQRDDFVVLHFGDGPLRPEVEEEILKYNLSGKYLLMGYHERVEDFFAVANLFMMSSEEEGLGSSVLDAFFHNVPVVTTNAGGLKETVERNGLLAEVGDFENLASRANVFLSDPKLVKLKTTQAHKFVIENYSAEKLVPQYVELFEKLVGK